MLGGDPKVNEPLTTAFAYLLVPQVIFYGLSSVFMAILNNRNVFGPPAWAPVVNNVVAIATLGLYLIVPGQLSVDPVRMGNAKLLVLGIGTTLGVVAQTAVLLVAIRRERVSLKPLWGIDDRLKRFGTMAAAMVLYVLISQVGLVVGTQIASTAAASGPAIYTTWLVLQLPFGMIGVTILTVVMPRLSRNAAADDTPAVLADLSLATRLTMVTLIPAVAFMTVAGPAIGSALFAYGKFGEVDANYLGLAIALSSFTLIPYALVLLQLRVFYARDDPWTPILMIVVITAVKIAASVPAPHLTDDPELVAGYLGTANGVGFVAGAVLGHFLLRRSLRHPADGCGIPGRAHRRGDDDRRRAGRVAGRRGGPVPRPRPAADRPRRRAGSMVRLLILAAVMLPVLAAAMLAAGCPTRWRPGARCGGGFPVGHRYLPRHPTHFCPMSIHKSRTLNPGRTANVAAISTGKGPDLSDQPRPTCPPDRPTMRRGRSRAKPPTTSSPTCPPGPPPKHRATPDDRNTVARFRSAGRHRRQRPLPPAGLPRRSRRLQFWQALDTSLDRQVALTFVDPDRRMSNEQVDQILTRTQLLSRIERPGLARVLDVTGINDGSGLVVAGGSGGSLRKWPPHHPRPSAAPARSGAGRRGRRGTSRRRGAVDRSPQSHPGQHRRRRCAGLPCHAG